MAKKTAISWTESTINAWIGCAKYGEECRNCYAANMEKRFKRAIWGVDARRYKTKGAEKAAYELDKKAKKEGRRIRVFMSSMSDFFENHKDVLGWRERWWQIVKECNNIDWLILTKRSEHIKSMVPIDFYSGSYKHVNLGVSVGIKKSLKRLDDLRALDDWGGLRFTSMEPLLEDLGAVNLAAINWVIVGGESTASNGFRVMEDSWVESIKRQCEEQGAVFFFKQSSGRQGTHSHEFKGKKYLELPMFNG